MSTAAQWQTQSIYFLEPKWTTEAARKWLREHGHTPIKRVHKLGTELRYRLREPDGFKQFRTLALPGGIRMVRGRR